MFRKATDYNKFLKASPYFKEMANSLGQTFQKYLEICIFCVIQDIGFQKQSVGSALKVLAKSLKLSLMKFILYLICIVSFYTLTLLLGKSFAPHLKQNSFQNFSPPLDTLTLTLYLFLKSET